MVRSTIKSKCFFFLSLVTSTLQLSWSATSALPYTIPAVIHLTTEDSYHCSGTVIGDRPLKVLTAVHCLQNNQDGGVRILDNRFRGTKSKKVYISNDPKYLAQAQLVKDAKEKLNSVYKSISEVTQAYESEMRTNPITRTPKMSELTKQRYALETEKQQSKKRLDDENTNLQMLFPEYDIAVLTFEVNLPGELSVSERIRNLEILPVAKDPQETSQTDVIVGGYGKKSSNSAVIPGAVSHFSTNILERNSNPKYSSTFQTVGYIDEQIEKLQVKRGELGAPLPGDSGGPAITSNGVAGVNSIIAPYAERNPPRPEWKNLANENYIFSRYEFILAYFPSASSQVAKEIYDRVEADTNSKIVFSDQAAGFSEEFYDLKAKILAAKPDADPQQMMGAQIILIH